MGSVGSKQNTQNAQNVHEKLYELVSKGIKEIKDLNLLQKNGFGARSTSITRKSRESTGQGETANGTSTRVARGRSEHRSEKSENLQLAEYFRDAEKTLHQAESMLRLKRRNKGNSRDNQLELDKLEAMVLMLKEQYTAITTSHITTGHITTADTNMDSFAEKLDQLIELMKQQGSNCGSNTGAVTVASKVTADMSSMFTHPLVKFLIGPVVWFLVNVLLGISFHGQKLTIFQNDFVIDFNNHFALSVGTQAVGIGLVGSMKATGSSDAMGAVMKTVILISVIIMVISTEFFNNFIQIFLNTKERGTPPDRAVLAANMESYLDIIKDAANDIFGHDSSFVLATICSAIAATNNLGAEIGCQYSLPETVIRALSKSWNRVGFRLFHILTKSQVRSMIQGLIKTDDKWGSGFEIQNFYISPNIRATWSSPHLFVNAGANDIDNVTRLLWLFRYIYAVFGNNKHDVPMKSSFSYGTPEGITASILRCFDQRYTDDNAVSVLRGEAPVTTITNDHVNKIIAHMKKFSDSPSNADTLKNLYLDPLKKLSPRIKEIPS
jgi:hypothetical protein